jgi:hypothetical protein
VCLDDCRIGVAESVRLASAAQLGAAQAESGARAGRHRGRRRWVRVPHGSARRRRRDRLAPSGSVVLGPRGDYRGAPLSVDRSRCGREAACEQRSPAYVGRRGDAAGL